MMHGREKSDSVRAAVKSPNKPGEPAAQAMERRVGGRGERKPATHAPDTEPGRRVTDAGARTDGRKVCPHYSRWEPDAGKLHVRFWAGGLG